MLSAAVRGSHGAAAAVLPQPQVSDPARACHQGFPTSTYKVPSLLLQAPWSVEVVLSAL